MTVLVFEKKVVSYSVAFSVMCIYGDPESFLFFLFFYLLGNFRLEKVT